MEKLEKVLVGYLVFMATLYVFIKLPPKNFSVPIEAEGVPEEAYVRVWGRRRPVIRQYEGVFLKREESIQEQAIVEVDANGYGLQRDQIREGKANPVHQNLELRDDQNEEAEGALEQQPDFSHFTSLQGDVTVHGSHLDDHAAADPDPTMRERRDKVRAAMIHTWSSYEKYAWGFDEMMPFPRNFTNELGGLGVTIINSLDTLYIMGLRDQFTKGTEWVRNNLDLNSRNAVIVSKTSMTVLGGLLSAYDLSDNPLFLTKAQELADRLLPAWDTTTGIPFSHIHLASGAAFNPSWPNKRYTALANLGSEQVEFLSLWLRTGIPIYARKALQVIYKLKKNVPVDGSLTKFFNPNVLISRWNMSHFGEGGEYFYANLLKVGILAKKLQLPFADTYIHMWEQSMEGLFSLVRRSTPSSYAYIASRLGDIIMESMYDDACYAPGMLALGAYGASPANASQYLETAQALAETCYNFHVSKRKAAREYVLYIQNGQERMGRQAYPLRVKTIESFFYLWRTTGDSKYRDWAWDIFQTIEIYARNPTVYAGSRTPHDQCATVDSFFLANTLKYLYLLYSPSSVMPLEEWVFNTEGHPMKIRFQCMEVGNVSLHRKSTVDTAGQLVSDLEIENVVRRED